MSVDQEGRQDTIYSQDGADQIIGSGGADIVDGGSDNDTITVARGADEIDGGSGDDWIEGGSSNDIIFGGLEYLVTAVMISSIAATEMTHLPAAAAATSYLVAMATMS